MSEPAKDEAELIGAIAWALWEFGCSDDGAAKATLAAIRAAGWAVMPVGQAWDILVYHRAENARMREALQHAHAALDSLMSDEMPYTESCRIWRIATGCIREALDLDGQKERRAKALSELAEMDADLLDIDPESKP
jgi:hypothetical protein